MPIGICRYGNEANVVLDGTLTYDDAPAFYKVFGLTEDKELDAIFVDFDNVEMIDEAGLGLLMLLRNRAKANLKRLALCRAHGDVERMLTASRFHLLFLK